MRMSRLFPALLTLIILAFSFGIQAQNAATSGQSTSNVASAGAAGATSSAQLSAPPVNAGVNSLWIKGAPDWTQQAIVSAGEDVTLLAVSPTGGNGNLNFADSNGMTYTYRNFFYPKGTLTFYADTPGPHILSFYANGKLSNSVRVDVGNYTPLSIMHLLTRYAPSLQYPGFYQQQG